MWGSLRDSTYPQTAIGHVPETTRLGLNRHGMKDQPTQMFQPPPVRHGFGPGDRT